MGIVSKPLSEPLSDRGLDTIPHFGASKTPILAWKGAQNRFPELFQGGPPPESGNRIQTPIRTPIKTPIRTPIQTPYPNPDPHPYFCLERSPKSVSGAFAGPREWGIVSKPLSEPLFKPVLKPLSKPLFLYMRAYRLPYPNPIRTPTPGMRNRPILSLNRIGTPIQTLNQNYSWTRP